jgi:hypothetical protein
MTESIRSRSASVRDNDSVDRELDGRQSLRRSRARQCGRSVEGEGVKPSRYGWGLPEEDGMGSSALNRVGVLIVVFKTVLRELTV